MLTVTPLDRVPMVKPGDDVARLLIETMELNRLEPKTCDVLVVTQKIVSKAEGRFVALSDVIPSARARDLADITGKDARLVEIILSETVTVLRAKRNVLIVETRGGLIMANAGIDQSNLDAEDHGARVLLLPADSDASALALKRRIDTHFATSIGVVISDSIGRAWRLGTVGLAIGAAGIPSLLNLRGEKDLSGRPLQVTEVGFADAVASAAVLVMGEAAEGQPAAIVRGLDWTAAPLPAKALVRNVAEDLFR